SGKKIDRVVFTGDPRGAVKSPLSERLADVHWHSKTLLSTVPRRDKHVVRVRPTKDQRQSVRRQKRFSPPGGEQLDWLTECGIEAGAFGHQQPARQIVR